MLTNIEKYKMIEGQKVGRLTILEYLGKKNKQHYFKCCCDCGNEDVIKSYNYLTRNINTKSCGCWNSERTILFNKETKTCFDNKYTKADEDTYTIEVFKNNTSYEVIVDRCGLNMLIEINRTLSIDSRGYAFITQEDTNGKQLFLHNIFKCGIEYYENKDGRVIDHINTNILDNRLDNLRVTDNFGNTQNANIRKDNTCGIKGFRIAIPKNRPLAHITVRIQAFKNRISKDFPLSKIGIVEAIKWNYNTRLEMHDEFSNFGFDVENKSLEDIVKELYEIFIHNLTEEQKRIFDNDGYIYKPKKFKPIRSINCN